MAFSKYILGLAVSVVISVLLYPLANLFLPLGPYFYFLISSIALFSIMSIIMHLLGKISIKNGKKNPFIFIVINNVLFKILACFLFVFIYTQNYPPQDSFFLIPFFWVYLIFLIFETYYLSNQAKNIK